MEDQFDEELEKLEAINEQMINAMEVNDLAEIESLMQQVNELGLIGNSESGN